MNSIYLVTPLALLAAFAGYVVPASVRLDLALAARAAAEEQQLADEHRADDERRRIASDEQDRRTIERKCLEKEKADAARATQVAQDQSLSDKLAQARAARDAMRTEIVTLDTRMRDLVTDRERSGATLHAARQALEALRIERRNADLELQRMTEILAEQIEPDSFAGAPLFPSPHPDRTTSS